MGRCRSSGRETKRESEREREIDEYAERRKGRGGKKKPGTGEEQKGRETKRASVMPFCVYGTVLYITPCQPFSERYIYIYIFKSKKVQNNENTKRKRSVRSIRANQLEYDVVDIYHIG